MKKEQLLNEVWAEAFVEEGSLPRAIHELRRVLGDDSSQPRFIETIPKRGYRFVAQVQSRTFDRSRDAMVIERHVVARVTTREEEVTDAGDGKDEQALLLTRSRPSRRRLTITGAAVLLGILAVAIAWVAYFRNGSSSPARRPRPPGPIRLTNNAAADQLPKWSPDGSKIVFVSNRDGKNEIYVMAADGADVKRLTNNQADDSTPAWSPDGEQNRFPDGPRRKS